VFSEAENFLSQQQNLKWVISIFRGQNFGCSELKGCQICLETNTKTGKICQITTKLPNSRNRYISNSHKIFKTLSILRLFKMYPILDFWCENKPSGNPAARNAAKFNIRNKNRKI
jgi:hypothetical protein